MRREEGGILIKGLLEYILDFQGIIGALAGVFVTLVTTHFLKNSGKLRVSIEDKKIDYYGQNQIGAIGMIPEIEKADYMIISFVIVVYNPSEVQKHIDKITFELIGSKNEILVETDLIDLSTAKATQHRTTYSQFKHINCEAKHLKRLSVSTTLDLKQEAMKNYKYMRMTFRNKRGKKKRLEIK
jgi:hypothetical protein